MVAQEEYRCGDRCCVLVVLISAVEGYALDAGVIGDVPLIVGGSAAFKLPSPSGVIDIVERYAPGLRRKILGRHVIAPADLEQANPNLVGGDSLGGSHHLGQQFIFRPFLGWSRYRTPVNRLFVCGASTWPGAGVGASSGWLLGQMLAQA